MFQCKEVMNKFMQLYKKRLYPLFSLIIVYDWRNSFTKLKLLATMLVGLKLHSGAKRSNWMGHNSEGWNITPIPSCKSIFFKLRSNVKNAFLNMVYFENGKIKFNTKIVCDRLFKLGIYIIIKPKAMSSKIDPSQTIL